MKKIFSFVFAAMMLLVSSSAMAQSETLKGDVNADGVVDVADIAAIIKIMQEAGGAVEATKYYWYVGNENPTSIDTSKEGWTELGSDLSSITKIQVITEDDYSFPAWYVLMPTSLGFKPYNVDGTKDESSAWDISASNITGYTLYVVTEGTLEALNSQFKK